ncbi:hypothetical protein [uncultured Mediterranean phage uvMED]|nr:hypothetical protein [uncultured Mediterranean phage uvMED]
MTITPELIETIHNISWVDGICYIFLGLGVYALYRWIRRI